MKSASLTTNDPQRKSSSDASRPSAGKSQVTSPINGLTSFQGATTAFRPLVPRPLGQTCLQPSAVVFSAGIAFDYVNFPRIVSVYWPEDDNQIGTSVVVRRDPQMATKETALNNIEVVTGTPVFKWGLPHNEPFDPLMSTPDKKEPMGITKRNSGELLKQTNTRAQTDFDKKTAVTQETMTSTRPLEKCPTQKQWECCGPTDQTISIEGKASVEKNPKKTSFDHTQLNVTNRRREGGKASNCELLGQKRARLNPMHVTFCLPDDNNHGSLNAQNSLNVVTHDEKKTVQSCFSIATSEQLNASDSKSKTFVSSAASTSSTESKQTPKDKTGNQSARGSRRSAEKVKQSRLQTGDADENVRDLITRIRYIKSRLHRAESDFRKKRMLRAIVALRKRVKALTEGAKKEKTDPGKVHQGTGTSEASYIQESAEKNKNISSGSNVMDMTDGELETNHVIMDKGDVSLKPDANQPASASLVEVKEQKCHDKQNGEELTNPRVVIAKYDNDAQSSETKTTDVSKPTTLCNSKYDDISMKNNSSRQDRGSLSLITSNGGNVPSLSLPFGIGLDGLLSCRKRAVSSSDDENDLQNLDNNDSSTKKLKGSSLSDEDLKGTSENKTEDVTHHVQNVTQDGALTGLVSNENNADKNNGTTDEGNVARNDDSDLLLTRKEFILCYPKDFTKHNNWDPGHEVVIGTVGSIKEHSPLDSEVQVKKDEVQLKEDEVQVKKDEVQLKEDEVQMKEDEVQMKESKERENRQPDGEIGKGDVSLLPDARQPASASSVEGHSCDNRQNREEPANSPTVIADHNNDTESSEAKTSVEKLKSTTSRNCKYDNINMKNSSCQKDRGCFSFIKANGGNVPSLSLPSGIGLESSSPCIEEASSSSDVGGKNFQKYENGTGKNEMKRLSLSDDELKAKINTKAEVVSHLLRNVTQDGADKINKKREKGNATSTDDCDLLTRREFILCYPDFTQYNNWEDSGVASDTNSPLDKKVQLQENEVREERQADCNVVMDGIKGIYNSNNNANEYSHVSEHKFCSEEIHDFRFNPRSGEDNANEGEHRSSLLERILLDEETQGFTSPTIYNPSGRKEDVDLIQSLQIREARIRDLARKRDRLLNLAGLKLK